jgi:lactoylglutathione lyase
MILKTTGIDHANLTVRNLEESCKFWKTLFGFDTLEEIPAQNGRIIGNQNALLALYENPDFRNSEKSGFNHLSFHLENFDEAEQKCKDMGIEIQYGGIVEWPKSRSIYIMDPNGYEIELVEVWGGGLVNRG